MRITLATALIILSSALGLAEEIQDEGGFEFALTTWWESQYLSEGVDALEEGGLFSFELVSNYLGLDWGLWFGLGDSVDYQELSLSVAKSFDLDWVELSLGAAHLEFWPDRAHDQELFAGASFILPMDVSLSVDGTYSVDVEGTFVEIALSRAFSCFVPECELEPYLLQAIDLGYRSESYDGWNHLELGCGLNYSLNEKLSLNGYVAHSFAQGDLDREGLGDETRLGLGLSSDF